MTKKEKNTLGKEYVHCLQPTYKLLQVGTITYLMITDTIQILHLKMSDKTAYTGYTGKIEEDML